MTRRLLIVSNRLPVTIVQHGSEFETRDSVGGLATGLGSIYQKLGSLWIGWPGIILQETDHPETQKIATILEEIQCRPVFLTEYEYNHYYNEFCNNAIWPLFHTFYDYAQYQVTDWNVYFQVNQKFCEAVCSIAQPGDFIWVHDYHLMLLPSMIRERIPDASIGFFLHIPFPPHELFRLIPRNNEILTGLLGADLIGFHTFEYLHYFLNTIRRILGYDQEMLEIISPSRRVKTDVFPMGIDVLKFRDSLDDLRVKKEIQLIRKEISQEKIILSIDRLEYTKGVPLRLKAFEKLLVDHEELRGKVTLLLVVVPSRTGIERYSRLRDEIEHLVGKINGLFGDIWWTPIRYLYRYLPFHQLIAAYAASDLALVTPLRDGMNLIAKEYLATKPEGCGMLILSEFAGAAKELGEAIIINPNDVPEFSRAIYEGLMMSEAEMRNRITPMQQRLLRYDLHKWTSDFIASLDCAKRHQDLPSSPWMDQDSISQACRSYHTATSRILFLDYDGTVFPLVQTPDLAKPDPEILSLLEALSHEHGTEVVIVSGRGREVLDAWFGHLPIGIIAEHGIWTKEKGNAWKMDTEVSGEWKADLIPVLESFRDRTPGSLIEEKEYALAWHFRNADPDLALVRARDLREELTLRIKNQHLILLDGHKVLEVKNAGIDKGTAVKQWYSLASYEFCFAAGDDRTDEDMFSVLPQRAFTIKVGSGPTRARLRVRSVDDIRQLLRCFIS